MADIQRIHITKNKALPLTPAQRRFNTLIGQIERVRKLLAAWRDNVPVFRAAYARELDPLDKAICDEQRIWALSLDKLLGQRNFTRSERVTAKAILCETINQLLEYEEDAGLKAIYDKHSEVSFDEEQNEELQALKSLGERFGGLDLGDDEVHSKEELLRRVQEQLAAHAEDQESEDAWPDQDGPDPDRAYRRRSSKSQSSRSAAAEHRRAIDAARVTQSVREVYRKLASALHPDREPDAERRATKTALMQKVNQAYDNNDLLTLLEAQLQIEQIDSDHLSGIDAQRLKNYNKVLGEQLIQLQHELNAVEEMFSLEFFIEPFAQLDPHRLNELTSARVKLMRRQLNKLRRDQKLLTNTEATQRWLERERRERRNPNTEMDFFF